MTIMWPNQIDWTSETALQTSIMHLMQFFFDLDKMPPKLIGPNVKNRNTKINAAPKRKVLDLRKKCQPEPVQHGSRIGQAAWLLVAQAARGHHARAADVSLLHSPDGRLILLASGLSGSQRPVWCKGSDDTYWRRSRICRRASGWTCLSASTPR